MPTIFRPFSTNGVNPKRVMGLGDRIERIVKPIAKALKMKCLDEKEQLKPESPCAKRRNKLNEVGKVIGIGKTNSNSVS